MYIIMYYYYSWCSSFWKVYILFSLLTADSRSNEDFLRRQFNYLVTFLWLWEIDILTTALKHIILHRIYLSPQSELA